VRRKDLIAPLLSGTPLGPVVSQIAIGFDLGWVGLVGGVILGVFIFCILNVWRHSWIYEPV